MDTGRSGKDVLLKENDAVLLIIDMQEKLVPAVADRERIVENVIRLARFSRIAGLPVVLTEQQKLGDTLPQIREHLEVVEPVSKLTFNCFGTKAFTEKVRALNRHTLILAGIEAHICVAQTALCALPEYGVQVVSDALSSRSPHNREVALRRMEQAGAVVTSTEMVIYEILERAGTDLFKAVLKLVK
ncbi:MAG: hydrolase [Deltaproteobacteria bacterium]|nr:hydrolase [Deltaproteobacteria bacterium]